MKPNLSLHVATLRSGLTISVLRIPAKSCHSWSEQPDSIAPKVLIVVSRRE